MTTAAAPAEEANSNWLLAALLCAAAVLLAIGLYRDTLLSMVAVWNRSDTFAHGWIIGPISLVLLWRLRGRLSLAQPRPNWAGAAALLLAVALWVSGHIAQVLVVQQLAFVAMMPALVWLVLGNQVVTMAAFPLAFLFFAVPFGEGLIPHLMEFTATFTVRALELSGIPVFRDGLHLSIPSGDFEVARACSGIRYLIASVALGSLFAYLTYRSWSRRAIFILLSALVPLLANGLRAYLIVVLAHLSGMRLAVGVDHLIYGWLFFGMVMFLLFWIGMGFRDDEQPTPAVAVAGTAAPGGRILLAAIAASIVLAAGPLMSVGAASGSAVDWQATLPAGRAGWQGPLAPQSDWRPVFHGAAQELRAQYRNGERVVEVYVARYGAQLQDAELVNSENRVYDSVRWLLQSQGVRAVSVGSEPRQVKHTRIHFNGRRMVVWNWYQIGAHTTHSDLQAKVVELSQRLAGNYQGAAGLALASSERGDTADAERTLADFLDAHADLLAACSVAGVGPCSP